MKKIIKASCLMIATLILLSTQMNLNVFSISNQETVQNTTETNETEASQENLDVAPETPTQPEKTTAVASGRMLLSTAGFANFDGMDLSDTNQKSYVINDFMTNARKLSVNAAFSADTTVTGRKLTVEIKPGLSLVTAPGFTYSSVTGLWSFNAANLPVQLQGIVSSASFTVDPLIYGYKPGSGTFVYNFSPGVTAAALDFQVKLDVNFSANVNGRDLSNLLTVRTNALISGVDTVLNEETFETMTIGPTHSIQPYGRTTVYGLAGEPSVITNTLAAQGGDIPGGVGNRSFVYDSLELIYKLPKALTVNDVTISNYTGMTYTLDTTTDPIYTIVTIKTQGISGTANKTISFTVTPPSDAVVGTTYSIGPANGSYKAVPYGSNQEITANLNPDQGFLTIARPFDNTLTLTNTANNAYYNGIDMDNITGAYLGYFLVKNTLTESATNQSIRVTFADPAIAVSGITLQLGENAAAKNVVVKTNNRTITLPVLNVQGNAGGITFIASITSKSLGYPDDIIQEVTYDLDKVLPLTGTQAYNDGGNSGGTTTFKYWGEIINPTAGTFTSTVTATNDGDFSSANAVSATNKVTIANNNNYAPVITSSLNGVTKRAGETFVVNHSLNTSFATLNNMVNSKTGFDIYLREDSYFSIDANTIVIKDPANGTEYSAANGDFIAVRGMDNTGKAVYKISLPNLQIGGFMDDGTQRVAPIVSYSMSVNKDATTTSVNLSQLIQVTPHTGNVIGNTTSQYYLVKNQYNIDGSGDLTKNVASASTQQVMYIQAQKDFTVTSAANINSGPWVTYDYATGKQIIDLNPAGTAKYQLSVSNNSGNTITGYTALIPIPKAGEQTDLTPATPAQFDPSVHLQKEAFQWTASIDQPVVPGGSLAYTVLYSTTYDTDKDSANFVAWDAITNKDDIRMIKVTTTDTIADGFKEAFNFPLVLSDPNADANAGKTNIYSARIYRSIDGNAGYKPSEPVAIRLKTGVVKGKVFNDTDRNSLMGSSELGRNGVSVLAYETGTQNLIETTTTSSINGVSGSFEFLGLDKNQNVDIIFVNPSTTDALRFSAQVAGGSQAISASDHLSAKISNLIPSSIGSDALVTGLIDPDTITYNAQGGTAVASDSKYPGEQITTEPVTTKIGYTLNGWFTAATGGSKVTFPYTLGTSNVTLYAQYTANTYVMSYDIATNGGTGTAPSDQQVTYDTLATAPTDPVKTGYTFTGWFDAAIGGTQWNFATNKMPANAVKLYAQFSINSYTLTLNDQGTTTTQTLVYDTLATAPTDPVKTGYTFNGWFDAATGGTQWDFATDKMPASNKTLYAQFSVNTYVMTLDNQGTTTPQNVVYDELAIAPTDPTKTGYTFTGWFTAVTDGTQWDFATDKMPASNKTLYAQFSINEYTLTFNNQGVTTTETLDYNELATEPADPEKTGYTFIGWFDAETGGTQWNFATDTMPAANKTLYAQFGIGAYILTFDNQGVTTIETLDYNELATEPTAPTKTGYTFIGWFTAVTGGTQWDFATSTMPAANMTLYAQFSINEYTLTFDNQGVVTTETLDYNELATEPTTPTKIGYTFIGWFDATTGGTQWDFATSTMPDADQTLYAQFSVNSYVMSFDNQGTITTLNVEYDTTVTEPATPIKAGYAFTGWFDAVTGGTQWDFATDTMPAAAKTLYAQFSALDQTLSFDVNGGDISSQPADIVQATDTTVDLSMLSEPTWFAHKFLGWADSSNTMYTGTITMTAQGLTLYAQWQDLIADGIWKIEANDVTMSYSDVVAAIQTNTLDSEILARSDAKAWDTETLATLSPLMVDNLQPVLDNPQVGSSVLTIFYADPNMNTTTNTRLASEQETLATTIVFTITDDATAPEILLPKTGQNELFISSGLGIISLILATVLFKKRK